MFDAATSLHSEDEPGYVFLRHSERVLTGEDQCRSYGCVDRDWYVRRPKSSILDAALSYVARGWEFFPAPPGEKKSHKSKKHSGVNWGKTTDQQQVRRDFKHWPNANIGIATGLDSGFFVVEADTIKGHQVDGIAELRKLEAKHETLPETLMAESPSGSVHRYFKHPGAGIKIKNSASEIAHGVDVRGDGGMVIAPPSAKPGSGAYRWINTLPLADAPGWLLSLVVDMPKQKTPQNNGGFHCHGPPGKGDEAPLEVIEAALAVIPNDSLGWEEWNRVGLACFRATNGAGFNAFDLWSQKSSKYDAHTTYEKWRKYFSSPPDSIGAGTIIYMANQASPGWRGFESGNYDFGINNESFSKEQSEDEAPKEQSEDESANKQTEDGSANKQPNEFDFRWHGDVDPNDSRPSLVQGLIPEVGSGLVSGQWGTYKTFAAIDLAYAVMSGEPFIEFDVSRRGGVLFIALEGASEMAVRLQGVIDDKNKITTRAPFAWVETCPPLLAKNAVGVLSRMAAQAATQLKTEFDLPLSLIVIDTLMIAAGFSKDGQENDAASSQAVMRTLANLARNAGCFVFGVDHFGKDISTGTRGSSAKEAAADVVLALLGDKDVAGAVGNTRMTIRKRRGGANGQEFPFKPRVVDMGTDKFGAQVTTLVIDWGATDAAPKAAKDRWSAKSLKLLRTTIMRLMVDCGTDIRPWADGPIVRALDAELVKREFYRSYLAEGESEKAKRDARWRAFKRATDDAQGKKLIQVREVGGITYIWLVDPSEQN